MQKGDRLMIILLFCLIIAFVLNCWGTCIVSSNADKKMESLFGEKGE